MKISNIVNLFNYKNNDLYSILEQDENIAHIISNESYKFIDDLIKEKLKTVIKDYSRHYDIFIHTLCLLFVNLVAWIIINNKSKSSDINNEINKLSNMIMEILDGYFIMSSDGISELIKDIKNKN